MLDLMLAAALLQTPADPCSAVPPGPAPAACPRWQTLHRGPVGELFFDPESVRREGDGFLIRTRGIFDSDRSNRTRSIDSVQHYDCVRRSYANRALVAYDVRGVRLGGGTPTGAQAPPQAIAPGTPHHRLLTRFCPR